MGMSLNRWSGIGYLGHSPRVASTGKVADFSMAVDNGQSKEGEDLTLWMKVKVFGKTVGVVEQYLQKGSRVAVEGRLLTEEYKARDGTTVRDKVCFAERVYFLSGLAERKDRVEAKPDHPSEAVDDLPF